MRRAVWTIGLCWLLAANASAQQPAALPLELRWQAPPECGSEADVRAQLERVAHALPGYALAPLRADARIDRQERLYALRLRTEHEGERGERKLEASDCPTLVRSMTLVLALAFGKGVELAESAGQTTNDAHAASSEPAGAARPPGAAAAAQDETAPSAQQSTTGHAHDEPTSDQATELEYARYLADEHRDKPDPWLWLIFGGGAQTNLFPEVAGMGWLGAELLGRSFTIALRMNVWGPSEADVSSGVRARFEGRGALLQGCWRNPTWAWGGGYALCATADAAALTGASRGAFKDGSATAPWLAFGGSASVTFLLLRLEAGLEVSLTRPRFVIAGLGPVHELPRAAFRLGVSLVVPIPL